MAAAAVAAALDEETAKKILRQVEFYFSDSNLPTDNFLWKTIEESDDSFVSLALICSFSRMRGHLGLATSVAEEVPEDTVKAVADVLKKSSTLKISADGLKVGRITELAKAEELIRQFDTRTIAVSPLEHDVKLEDMEIFFGQFAKVNSVRLPRHVADRKLFCGTALVEFASQEDAESIMNKSLVYSGAKLELEPKKIFYSEREKLIEEHKNSAAQYSNRKNAEPEYPKGLIVSFKLKRVKNEGSAELNGVGKYTAQGNAPGVYVDVPKPDGGVEVSDDVNEKADNEGSAGIEDSDQGREQKVDETNDLAAAEKDEDQSSDGASDKEEDIEELSRAASHDGTDVIRREDLKAIFSKFGTVKYIDFVMGAESGYIRFEGPEEAQKARAATVLAEEGGLLVKDFIVTLEPVTGDAEKEYWKAVRENQGRVRDRDNRGGRGGRGGKYSRGKRPRSRDQESGGGPNKVRKVPA